MIEAIPILVPLAGVLMALATMRRAAVAFWISVAAAVATVGSAVVLWAAVTREGAPLILDWYVGYTSFVTLQADGLAAPMVALLALGGMAGVTLVHPGERRVARLALTLLAQAAAIAAVLAADIVLWYVAWVTTAMSLAALVATAGDGAGLRGAVRLGVQTLAAGGLVLVAFAIVVRTTGGDTSMLNTIVVLTSSAQGTVFGLLAAGLLLLLPVWPAHSAITLACKGGPAGSAAALVAMLPVVSAYSLLRLGTLYAPAGFAAAGPWLAGLGIGSAIYGATNLLRASDAEQTVAYLTVSGSGVVLLGLATGTEQGYLAAVLVLIGSTLAALLVLVAAGPDVREGHTPHAARQEPRRTAALVLGVGAAAGVPFLGRFPGMMQTVKAAFDAYGPVALTVLGCVVLLGAWAVRTLRPAFVRSSSRGDIAAGDLTGLRLALALVLGALVVSLGVWSAPVRDVAATTLRMLAAMTGAHS